jgi:hypothetical protein
MQVVFVGGTVTALYALDGGADVRPTVDVDCVIDVATTAEYYAFVDRLRGRGFRECTDEGAPLCRWTCAGIRVDITATVDTGIGPTNRWYRDAVANAATYSVANDVEALAITPIYFVATKLEAFRARGNADFLASHDLEDLLTVIAGCGPLRDEIVASEREVTRSVRAELRELARKDAFIDAVPAHFDGDANGQALADALLAWIAALTKP